jgi:hypothetical protein
MTIGFHAYAGAGEELLHEIARGRVDHRQHGLVFQLDGEALLIATGTAARTWSHARI